MCIPLWHLQVYLGLGFMRLIMLGEAGIPGLTRELLGELQVVVISAT